MHLPARLQASTVALIAVATLSSVAMRAQHPSPDAFAPTGIANSLSNLADQPATHTGVLFDRSMIQMAQGMLQQSGMDADRAAAALTSISFDSYRYREPAFYTPETMAFIVSTFHRAGWNHLVNGNQATGNQAQPVTMITDVWLHFSGTSIDHVTVLMRGPKDMDLVQVAGDLRPLDLIHLSGHFGIPKVDPNAVMVPAPDGR